MADADERITLSIDIGTTTVVGARSAEGGGEIVVRMPATVGVDAGEVVTGERAAALALTHPDQTVSQLVRRLGDSSPIIIDGKAFNIGDLLGHVVSDVATQAAIEPATTRLVLTHPSAWKDHRLTLLASIGASQGFPTVELVSDAVAATTPLTLIEASGDSVAQTRPAHVLVVDVGGGTVDATVVAIDGTAATVVATQTLERLGGNDFDQAVFGHVMASVDNMIADLDRRDPAVRQSLLALRASCTTAKERLSTDTDATVVVKVPGLDTAVRITRAEFESVIRPQVEAIVTIVDRVVASSGIERIDRVITTGGSAAVPLIGETLSGHLGQSVAAGDDPAGATALGATIPPRPVDTTNTTNDTNDTNDTKASTTTSERGTTMTDEGTTPADAATSEAATAQTAGGDAASGPAASGSKHVVPPPPEREKKETSTGAKVAVGATVAAAAAAAAVVFGDDVAAAVGLDDEADDSSTPAAPKPADDDADTIDDATDDTDADTEPTSAADRDSVSDEVDADGDSMDAFDTVAATPDAGPTGVPLSARDSGRGARDDDGGDDDGDFGGGGGASAFRSQAARPAAHQNRPQARHDDDDDGRGAPARPQRQAPEPGPAAVHDAPVAPQAAPVAAATAAAATTAPPPPAQTAPPQPSSPSDPGPADAGDARFEAARQTLLDRLENFEAPEGTSPEDAADLRQELADAVARFQPLPGESTEASLAAMRDDFDRRVQDFVQDQKIDSIVDEMERDNAAEAAAAAAAADSATEVPPIDPTAAVPESTDPAPVDPAATVPDSTDPTIGDPPVEAGAAGDPPVGATVGQAATFSADSLVVTLDPGALATAAAAPLATQAAAIDSAAISDDFEAAAARFQVPNVANPTDDLHVKYGDVAGQTDGPDLVQDAFKDADFKFAEIIQPTTLADLGQVEFKDAEFKDAALEEAALEEADSRGDVADADDAAGGSPKGPNREHTFQKARDDRNETGYDDAGETDDEGEEGTRQNLDDDFVDDFIDGIGPDIDLDSAPPPPAVEPSPDLFDVALTPPPATRAVAPPPATPPVEPSPDFVDVALTPPPATPAGPAQLDDDFVGDSVYSAVVDTPISVIDVPAPDGILIGLDQPSPEGILIGLDQPGVSEFDAGGLQVGAPVTEAFVPPVYAESEPFMADVPIVEEAVQDFGIQGLEDEGNIPADDVPDDMLDG